MCQSSLFTPFRRLHEGNLFQVKTDFVPRRPGRESAPKSTFRRKVEHSWLCGECAPLVTLAFDQKQRVVTVPPPKGEGTKTVTVVDPVCRRMLTTRPTEDAGDSSTAREPRYPL